MMTEKEFNELQTVLQESDLDESLFWNDEEVEDDIIDYVEAKGLSVSEDDIFEAIWCNDYDTYSEVIRKRNSKNYIEVENGLGSYFVEREGF
ncbi:MAG: hypothetical protein MJ237_08675 [bacterium]|nr:hypothetical protein [bacterium]